MNNSMIDEVQAIDPCPDASSGWSDSDEGRNALAAVLGGGAVVRLRPKARRKAPALVVAAALILLAAVGTLIAVGDRHTGQRVNTRASSPETPPTALVEVPDEGGTLVPNPGVTHTQLPTDSDLARAVSALLPGNPAVQTASRTKSLDGRADYTTLSTVIDGVGYEVTVYKVFAEEKFLSDTEIPKLDVPRAQAWGGGSGSPVKRIGVYYLTQGPRVGLFVASLNNGDAPLGPIEPLLAIARTAAKNPVVIEAAKPDN
ncbi:MAG: hypothetical protein ACR2MB_02015 [Acidimicrobiales bacterium]